MEEGHQDEQHDEPVGGLPRVAFHLYLLTRPHPAGDAVVDSGPLQRASHEPCHDEGNEPTDDQDAQRAEQVGQVAAHQLGHLVGHIAEHVL